MAKSSTSSSGGSKRSRATSKDSPDDTTTSDASTSGVGEADLKKQTGYKRYRMEWKKAPDAPAAAEPSRRSLRGGALFVPDVTVTSVTCTKCGNDERRALIGVLFSDGEMRHVTVTADENPRDMVKKHAKACLPILNAHRKELKEASLGGFAKIVLQVIRDVCGITLAMSKALAQAEALKEKLVIQVEVISKGHSDEVFFSSYGSACQPNTAPENAAMRLGLDRDPRRIVVSLYCPWIVEKWEEMPDIGISMAATPLGDWDPPSAAAKVRMPTWTEYGPAGVHSTPRVFCNESVVETLVGSLAVRTLAAFVEARPQHPEAWLQERLYDPIVPSVRARLAYRPLEHMYFVALSPMPTAIPSLNFRELEEAEAAQKLFGPIARRIELSQGRQFAVSGPGLLQAAREWEEEVNGQAFASKEEELKDIRDNDRCCGKDCPQHAHRCRGSGGVHDINKKFGCDMLVDGYCPPHRQQYILHWYRSTLRIDNGLEVIKTHDGRRGIYTSPDALQLEISQMPELIFTPISVSAKELKEAIGEYKESTKELLDTLCNLEPSLSRQALEVVAFPSKPASTTDILYNATQMLQFMRPSIDMTRQYKDWSGGDRSVAGHSSMSCCLVPTWFNMSRYSGHPLGLAIWMCAVQVTAAALENAAMVLGDLQKVHNALRPVEVAYRNAKRRNHLDLALAPLSDDAHRLLASSEHSHLPAISAAVKAATATTIPSIGACIESYQPNPTGAPASMEEEDRREFLLESGRLLTEMRLLEDSDCDSELVPWFDQAAAVIEQHFAVSLTRNADRMPTAFWPASTSTKAMFQMALRAWARAWWQCDDTEEIACTAGTRQAVGCWWRVLIIWMIHIAATGAVDALSGLPLDLSGETYNLLAPTLCAHKTHTLPFFGPLNRPQTFSTDTLKTLIVANATVQSRYTNLYLGKRPIAAILQAIDSSRDPSLTLMKRLRCYGLLQISDADLDAIRTRQNIVRPEHLEALRLNAVIRHERWRAEEHYQRGSEM